MRRPNPTPREMQKHVPTWKDIYSHAYAPNTGVKWEPAKEGKQKGRVKCTCTWSICLELTAAKAKAGEKHRMPEAD